MLDLVSKLKSGMHSIKRWMWNVNQMKQEAKFYGPQYPGNILRYSHAKAEFIPLQDCKYTCHFKCYQQGVRLDCSENRTDSSKNGNHDVSPDFTFVSAKDSALTSLSREELLRRTAEYNFEMGKKVMKVEPDEGTSFFGPLTVYFNLSRPVSIKSGSPVPTFCNSLKRYDHSVDVTKRRTSFFFPKAQVESLSITSDTTAQEVIDCLLKRYKLIDNPHKFALFERTERNGEVLMRKLEDDDIPLLNVLFWGPNNPEKSMELRENETGIVQWEAFTVPELDNFLRILEKEEEEYIDQVRKKYLKYQEALKEAWAEKEKERMKEANENGVDLPDRENGVKSPPSEELLEGEK